MKSKDYWIKRALQVKQAEIDKEDALVRRLNREYDRLKKSVSDELASFYGRYAANEGISMTEARRLLTNAERENFRISLDEFREMAQAGGYEKELDAIYLRSRISRLQALQTQLDYLTRETYQNQHNVLTDSLGASYENTYYQTVYSIQNGAGTFTGSFAHIDADALSKALSTPWLGSDFSARVWSNRDLLIGELRRELSQAIVRGDSLDKVSRRLAKRMDVARSRAETLVRTEAGHIVEQATLDSYRECDTKEYVFLATLDLKTCEICGPLDHRTFKVSEAETGVNYPLMHPRCRCTTAPASEYQAPTRAARDPVTGKTVQVENMSYAEWRKKYVEDQSARNLAKPIDSMYTISESGKETYTKQEIIDEMSSSAVGQKALKWIEDSNVRIVIREDDYSYGNRGDQEGRFINLYPRNIKNVRVAAQTLIHEMGHYHYEIGRCQHAEAICLGWKNCT